MTQGIYWSLWTNNSNGPKLSVSTMYKMFTFTIVTYNKHNPIIPSHINANLLLVYLMKDNFLYHYLHLALLFQHICCWPLWGVPNFPAGIIIYTIGKYNRRSSKMGRNILYSQADRKSFRFLTYYWSIQDIKEAGSTY